MYEYVRDGVGMFILWCGEAIWVLCAINQICDVFWEGEELDTVGHVVNKIT